MKRFHLFTSLGLLALFLGLSGCVSNDDNGRSEFTKTITFSQLETFSFKTTLISGMAWRESEEYFLEDCSKKVLEQEMAERGFELVDGDADFFAVVKWRKSVSSYVNHFDPVDGPIASLNRRNALPSSFTARVSMVIELYRTETGQMFWRKDLPNLFDAIQFTEERVRESLKRGIRNFPERIEKDPNLPDIE